MMTKNQQISHFAASISQSFNSLRWLITGGCGFIGLNLIKNLMGEKGHYIRIVDNLSVGSREYLSQTCNFTELDPKTFSPKAKKVSSPSTTVDLIVADILDEKLALKAAQDIDVIVHLAANTGVSPSIENPRSDCLINVIGTLNYLEASRHNNVNRFIFASSGASVGECSPPIHEKLVPHPISPYGAGKLAGEGYCSAYYRTYGVESVALRFGNVYGPLSEQKNSVVAKFIKRALKGKSLEIYGNGKQTRDFIYVDDLINSIRLSAIVKGIGGQVFQIATSHESTINELVEKLLAILSGYVYHDIEVKYGENRIGDVRRNYSDTSKAINLLNWQSKVDFETGLYKTVEWFLGKNF